MEIVSIILQATNIQQYPNAGGLGYYAQLLSLSYISGLKAKGYYQLAAGYGTVGYEPEVDSFFGTPRSIKTGGVAFDIPMIHVIANQEGDAEQAKQFTLQVGTLSSALEHITPEQMFAPTDPTQPSSQQPDAISAVKALQKASAAGQKIYQINQANMNQVLPLLHHDCETLNEIKRVLNVGKDVTTHTDAVSIPGGWSGFGYIITDPVVGDGVYKISGGLNGGWLGGLVFGMMLASMIAVAAITAGPIGIALLIMLLGQIVLPIYLYHKSVYGNDPEIWACWQAGFSIGISATGIAGLFKQFGMQAGGFGILGEILYNGGNGTTHTSLGYWAN